MKKIFSLLLLSALLFPLAACSSNSSTTETEELQRANIINDLQTHGDLQPGGTVTITQGSDGSYTYDYENPDGTAGSGGGVILD